MTKTTLFRTRPVTRVTPKQLVAALKRQAKRESSCKHVKLDPHACPYLIEILKDKRTKCRCCVACQAFCASKI